MKSSNFNHKFHTLGPTLHRISWTAASSAGAAHSILASASKRGIEAVFRRFHRQSTSAADARVNCRPVRSRTARAGVERPSW
eukprot:364197-Chlamydomonas_euryale.AAC.23